MTHKIKDKKVILTKLHLKKKFHLYEKKCTESRSVTQKYRINIHNLPMHYFVLGKTSEELHFFTQLTLHLITVLDPTVRVW